MKNTTNKSYIPIVLFSIFFFIAGIFWSRRFPNASELKVDDVIIKLRLSNYVKANAEKVCIFYPYATNPMAKEALGFEFDLDNKTNIGRSDAVYLLVFVKDNNVIDTRYILTSENREVRKLKDKNPAPCFTLKDKQGSYIL